MKKVLLRGIGALVLAALLMVGGCLGRCENPLAGDPETARPEDPVGYSFGGNVDVEFTIGEWWYGDYCSLVEVAFVHQSQVLYSHDAGMDNAITNGGWVDGSFGGYVFAYSHEADSFTLVDVPALADVTEVHVVINDCSNGTFHYHFRLESVEGRPFVVSARQGNEVFVLTPDT